MLKISKLSSIIYIPVEGSNLDANVELDYRSCEKDWRNCRTERKREREELRKRVREKRIELSNSEERGTEEGGLPFV